jgi:aminomethyltransferase
MLDLPNFRPGPPRPSRILTPRGFSRHLGQERHVVPGAGAVLLQLTTGDRLVLVNDEGGQPVEVVAARPGGTVDAGLLGQSGGSSVEGLKALLARVEGTQSRLRLKRGLAVTGYRPWASRRIAAVCRVDSSGRNG